MTPEVSRFVSQARDLLARAETMLGVGLSEDAGRGACLACYHAAQALVFAHVGRVFKTHHGVQTEFLRLTRDDRRLEPDLRSFLSEAYNLKTIADYQTGPAARTTFQQASLSFETARRFVAVVTEMIPRCGTNEPTGR